MKFASRIVGVWIVTLGLFALSTSAVMAQEPDAGSANPVVNLAHFAPFGADNAGTSVTVRINGSDVFTQFVYPTTVPAITLLPAGDYLVEIIPTGAAEAAISGTVSLAADTQYTLLAVGDGANQPLGLRALVDDTVAAAAGSAKVRIAHFAPFAGPDLRRGDAATAGAEVDICDDATGTPVPGLTNVPFDTVSPYLPLPAGIYDLSIAVAGTNCATVALDLPAIDLVSEQVYDIFAIGKNNAAFPLEIKTFTGLDFPATVTVGHFAPFAADVAGTAVDIAVNGTVAITDFVYGEFVTGLALPSGNTLVEVLVAGTSTVALSGTLPLAGGKQYDLFAIGGKNSQPLAFSATEISTTVPVSKGLVTVGHLAPFSSNPALTAVNICTDAGTPIIENFQYPQVAANLVLDPGIYNLKITAPGSCAVTLFDMPPFFLTAGDNVDAFAIGSGIGDANFPINLVTTTGLPTPYYLWLPIVAKQSPNIVQIASAEPDLSLLVAALQAAGLDDDLAGPGPFTVFAPTNAAIEKFMADNNLTAEQLLQSPLLSSILLYHVVAGTIMAGDLTDGQQVATLQGGSLTFAINGGAKVNGVHIIATDNVAANGVIHLIDAILIPAQ